jgi:hypothetical protein
LWVASARLFQSEALAIGHPPQSVLSDLIVSWHCPPPIASYARKCSQRYSRSHGNFIYVWLEAARRGPQGLSTWLMSASAVRTVVLEPSASTTFEYLEITRSRGI